MHLVKTTYGVDRLPRLSKLDMLTAKAVVADGKYSWESISLSSVRIQQAGYDMNGEQLLPKYGVHTTFSQVRNLPAKIHVCVCVCAILI